MTPKGEQCTCISLDSERRARHHVYESYWHSFLCAGACRALESLGPTIGYDLPVNALQPRGNGLLLFGIFLRDVLALEKDPTAFRLVCAVSTGNGIYPLKLPLISAQFAFVFGPFCIFAKMCLIVTIYLNSFCFELGVQNKVGTVAVPPGSVCLGRHWWPGRCFVGDCWSLSLPQARPQRVTRCGRNASACRQSGCGSVFLVRVLRACATR